MKEIKKMWKLGWGLTSQSKKQKVVKYELSSVYSKVDLFLENHLISQKYFYCDNDNKEIKIFKFQTINDIKIKKKEKEQLISYLKEKKRNIKYFEKFDGYINFIKFEGYKEGFDYLIKGVYIQFINNLLKKNRNIIFFIQNEKDIEILLLIFKYYLNDFLINISREKYLENLNIKKLGLNKNLLFYIVLYNNNIENLIKYFNKYLSLLRYINNVYLKDDFITKNYLYIKAKDDIDSFEIKKFFEKNIEKKLLFLEDQECFLMFEGLLYLIEVEFIVLNVKTKRFVLFFYHAYDGTSFIFDLFDKDKIDIVLNIINMLWIDDNDCFDEFNFDFKSLENKIYDPNFYKELKNNIIFEGQTDIIITENMQIIKLANLTDLIFHLAYYSLFF